MYCHKCGKQIDDEAVMCPGCGTPTMNDKLRRKHVNKQEPKTNPNSIWKLIVGGFFIISALGAFGENTILMILHMLIGGGLILWWFAKDWRQNNEDE